jgi:hypothetical protein
MGTIISENSRIELARFFQPFCEIKKAPSSKKARKKPLLDNVNPKIRDDIKSIDLLKVTVIFEDF